MHSSWHKDNISMYRCKKQLAKYCIESKYYLSSKYADVANKVILLVKFVDKQYLLPTLFGNFHYSSLYTFRNMESAEKDIKIGDIDEGIYPCDVSKEINNKLSFGDLSPKLDKLSVKREVNFKSLTMKSGYGLSDNDSKKIGIISFFAIRSSAFDEENLNVENFNRKVPMKKLNQVVLTMMHNFNQEGRIPIIIPMSKENIIAFKENSMYSDFISYVDEKDAPEFEILKSIDKNSLSCVFYKRKRYQNQLEYRLVDTINNLTGKSQHIDGLKGMLVASENELSKYRFAWI